MGKIFLFLLMTFVILNHTSAMKNRNSTNSNSKSSSTGIKKQKHQNHLPNRHGSLTRDPIFGELIKDKAGPPRKKRVRTILPSIAFHNTGAFMPHMLVHHIRYNPMFNQPYAYRYTRPTTLPFPYPRMPTKILPWIRSMKGYQTMYSSPASLAGYQPVTHVQSPTIATPYYLFSKCAGLQEFPETLTKLAAQFSSLDKDGNGLLSKLEWEHDILKQLKNTNTGVNEMFVDSTFKLVDKDGNNAMDFAELLEVSDRNQDGVINELEFELFWLKIELSEQKPFVKDISSALIAKIGIMALAFQHLDGDNNQRVKYTEFLQLDLDRDGEVSQLEFYYFLFRLSFDETMVDGGNVNDETEYVSQWLKEANKLPLKMLKLSFTSFDRVDMDFNGGLDNLEYLRLKENLIIAYTQESHKLIFDLNDVNNDGFITIEEQKTLQELTLEEVDPNEVRFEDNRSKTPNKKEFAKLISSADANKDGKISKEEYILETETIIKCSITDDAIQLNSDILSFHMRIDL